MYLWCVRYLRNWRRKHKRTHLNKVSIPFIVKSLKVSTNTNFWKSKIIHVITVHERKRRTTDLWKRYTGWQGNSLWVEKGKDVHLGGLPVFISMFSISPFYSKNSYLETYITCCISGSSPNFFSKMTSRLVQNDRSRTLYQRKRDRNRKSSSRIK